jgi:hypothetical protein
MKPGIHLWMLKPRTIKAVDAHKFTKQAENFKQNLSARKLVTAVFWDRKGVLMMGFMQQGTTITSKVYCEALKILRRLTQKKKSLGMLISGVALLHDNACLHTAALGHCWSVSTGSCLTTFLRALISLGATASCLPTWRTGWDPRASTVMRSWWKMSKRGWVHRRQTSLS